MPKIWINPLRNLWVKDGQTALHAGQAVELEEDAAQELLKNGWAELAEKPSKAKGGKGGKQNSGDNAAGTNPPDNPNGDNAAADNPSDSPNGDAQVTDGQTPNQPSLSDV